jgi:hypothetical protein
VVPGLVLAASQLAVYGALVSEAIVDPSTAMSTFATATLSLAMAGTDTARRR